MNAMLFLLDAAMAAAAAWLAWRALAGGARGIIEQLLGWGIGFVGLVAGSGVVLGALGGLGRSGFVLAHLAALIGFVALRRRHLSGEWRELRALISAALASVRKDLATRSVATVLGIFLAVTGLLAALAEPVVYDALTYRLSRIGHWLQEGRVAHFITNDPRQNYMPIVPDLVMAWLVSAFPDGFHGAALAQWGGGVLMLLATAGLARLAGLGCAAALGAALLAAGTANVAPQFTTVHTDLFTAGLLTAAFYLWQKAARRGEGSWLAGIGGGLALGAKGTVLYLGPTLLLWSIWTGRQLRLPLAAWWRTTLATMIAVAAFALPGFLRNEQTYGGLLGPVGFVSMHHQAAGGRLLHKTGLNLGSSLVQVAEPNSQFPGLSAAARALGGWLADKLPQQDSFSYEGLNRRETLQTIVQRAEPDADATSFGLLALVLFVAGAAGALRSNRAGAGEISQWSAGVVVFFVFFHAMQQWHPYGFRYFILVAPWMAVSAAWWLEGLSPRLQWLVWTLVLAATTATAGQVLTHTHQAGWRAVTQPERSRSYYVYHEWRAWSSGLDQSGEPLRIALPFNRPLAAFYRLQPARPVGPQMEATLAGGTAEQALAKFGGGWLIVPALQFMGNEGRVSGRTWLYEGDPASPFSVAAYHQLPIAEGAEPLVYRNQVRREADRISYDLLVRAGEEGRVTLGLESVPGGPWHITVLTPTEVRREEWDGGKSRRILTLPANQVAEVSITLAWHPGMAQPGALPLVEITR